MNTLAIFITHRPDDAVFGPIVLLLALGICAIWVIRDINRLSK